MEWDDSKMPEMNYYTVESAPPYVCPLCGKRSLHFYLNRNSDAEHGGIWNWCDQCYSYTHGSCRIPGWWKNFDIIDPKSLFHSPEYLNEHRNEIDEWDKQILEHRVLIDDLEYDDEIFVDTYYNDELFTGTAISIGKDGSYEEWNFVNGFGEGVCFGIYPNGGYEYYSEVSHGVEIVEKEWNKDGILTVDNQVEPMLSREYYDDGKPKREVSDDHLLSWYPNGRLKIEYIVAQRVVTYYASDGIWHTKLKNEGYPIVFDESKMEFNDGYINRHYLELLEDFEEFYPFFIRWLARIQGISGHQPSADLAEIICSLIASSNPELKYNGINLAADYQVMDAIPLIEQETKSRIKPHGGENHGYADPIGKRACIALKKLQE